MVGTVPTILTAIKRKHAPEPDNFHTEIDEAVQKAVPKMVQHKTQRSGFAYFYQNVE